MQAALGMEEFQEADILWPDHHHHHHTCHCRTKQPHAAARRPGSMSTAPVGIPGKDVHPMSRRSWVARSSTVGSSCYYDDDDGTKQPAEAIVPPHILAARRYADDRVAFSVCVGHGRTLKGRDLRSVRTAVLRMTGFLES